MIPCRRRRRTRVGREGARGGLDAGKAHACHYVTTGRAPSPAGDLRVTSATRKRRCFRSRRYAPAAPPRCSLTSSMHSRAVDDGVALAPRPQLYADCESLLLFAGTVVGTLCVTSGIKQMRLMSGSILAL